MKATHQVVYVGDDLEHHFALVKASHEDGTKDLLVWLGVDGWTERIGVVHGSSDQPRTHL